MCVPCHACVLADELAVEGGRQLLQGVRPFSKVTAHKVGHQCLRFNPQSWDVVGAMTAKLHTTVSPAAKHAGHHSEAA
jgi:hypothetical protein